jgi:hypothetical protein
LSFIHLGCAVTLSIYQFKSNPMIFTSELLSKLERDPKLKKAYATQGSMGQNRLVALPVIVAFIAAFGAYTFYGMAKTDPAYNTYTIICGFIITLCIAAVIIIQINAKKKILGNLDEVKVCLAKTIYGNDATGAYYCIYTPGSKRHDADFIETIADSIINIGEEPDDKIRAKIDQLFRQDFEGVNVTPALLPVEFTDGEEVYRKEFKLLSLETDMKQNLIENDDKFVVLSYNNRSVIPVKSLK